MVRVGRLERLDLLHLKPLYIPPFPQDDIIVCCSRAFPPGVLPILEPVPASNIQVIEGVSWSSA